MTNINEEIIRTIISHRPIVRLDFNYRYFDKGFIINCLWELMCADELSDCQKLVMLLLHDITGTKVENDFRHKEIEEGFNNIYNDIANNNFDKVREQLNDFSDKLGANEEITRAVCYAKRKEIIGK